MKNLKFCKQCMSIGDLSLHQPVFSLKIVLSPILPLISIKDGDCREYSAPLPTAPPPPTPRQPKSLHHRLKANLTSTVISY